jgi:hypothetical protein
LCDEVVALDFDLAAHLFLTHIEAEAVKGGEGGQATAKSRPPGLYAEPDGTYTHIHPDGAIEYLKDDVLV